jgi:hypothetical protein
VTAEAVAVLVATEGVRVVVVAADSHQMSRSRLFVFEC